MDERQILLEAKDLITRKQYQEARRILQPIAQHPTARKWLDTLDKIAPPPSSTSPFLMDDDPFAFPAADPFASPVFTPTANPYANLSDEEKFERVKALLKTKNYDEARQILMTLPDDPAAQQLLSKLDQIRPSKPPTFVNDASAFSAFQSTPRKDSNPFKVSENAAGYTLPQKDTSGIPPYSKPWNPQTLLIVIITFSIGALVLFSMNWRRFGRPKWALPSFFIGVLLIAVPFGGLGIASAAGVTLKSDIAVLPILAGLLGYYGYLFGLYGYQVKEYKQYEIYGDIGGRDKYRHDVYWLAGAMVVLVVGLLGAVMVVSTLATRPKEINTDYLTVKQPAGWTTNPNYEANTCSDYPQGCFLFLRELGTDVKVIAFVYFPLDGATYETRVSNLWRQYQTWYPYLQFGPQSQIVIDGQPITFQEFVSPPVYSPSGSSVGNYYVSRGYVPTTTGLIEITFWSSSEPEFRQNYADFMEVFETIDVK